MNPPALLSTDSISSPPGNVPDSLFERVGWFYAFLRTHVFRDDSQAIARALQLAREPVGSVGAPVLAEIGCGPGFYARHLAGCFPRWVVRGVDHSHEQLRRAREAARRSGLSNCLFEWSDATALDHADASIDGVFASRLFTVLEPVQLGLVLSEMHRVLRPGGRCFLAEPRSRWRAAIPLKLLWLLARFSPGLAGRRGVCREPRKPTVLSADHFQNLVASQPWTEIRCWEDGHYQYALARKRGPSSAVADDPSADGDLAARAGSAWMPAAASLAE